MSRGGVVAWLRLCRVPNTLTAATDVVAGAALAGVSLLEGRTWIAAAGSMLVYAGGVALNDVEDAEKDRALHPGRPIPSGAVSRGAARVVACLLLALGVAATCLEGPRSAVVALLLGAAVVAYDRAPDASRTLGPSLMGAARALNLLRGAALAAAWSPEALVAAGFHGALIFLVTTVSLDEDRPADAPSPRRLRVALLLLPAAYAGPVVAAGLRVVDAASFGAACGVAVLASLLAAHVTAPARGRSPSYGPVVPRAVFGLVPLDALYVLAAGLPGAAVVIAAAAPLAALARRALAQRGS